MKPRRPGALALCLTLVPPATVAQVPELYEATIRTSQFEYDIIYNIDPSSDIYTSDANAQAIADHYDPAGEVGLHENYLDLGFREVSPRRRDIYLQNAGWTGGRSNALFPGRIVLDTDDLNGPGHATVDTKGLCAHELHHLVQYEYIPWGFHFLSYYPVGIEGPAVAMEDAVNLVLDNPAHFTSPWGYSYGAFHGQVHQFLSGVHDEHFWTEDGYSAGLFWKYLMEQYGTRQSDPGWGADFLQAFYILADESDEGLQSVLQELLDRRDRQTTAEEDRGVSLRDVFQDFSIANWTRRYENPEPYAAAFTITVPDPQRFLYLDENSASPTSLLWVEDSAASPQWRTPIAVDENEPEPDRSHGPLAPAGNTGLQTGQVGKWASEYYFCDFEPPTTDGQAIGFWAESHSTQKAWFALIGLRASGTVDLIEKGSVTPNAGNAFQHSVIQSAADPYTRLIAVAIGEYGGSRDGYLLNNVDFDYYFSYFEPVIEILDPNADYQAYVGDDPEPERFLARVSVTSPDYLGSGSITGLTPELFTVAVGTPAGAIANQGEVLSAAYVLGEYWLTVKPPEKTPLPTAAEDLTVAIGSASDVSPNSVVYEDLVVDQVLVIDRSSSMLTTVGGVRRIDAARAAAQLFVDASGSDDQVGIVRFSGDDNEPDSPDPYGDGEVVYSLTTMSSQNTRDVVNYIIDETNHAGDPLEPPVPLGTTSIGDGLYWGAKELSDNGAPDSERWIILLSDGHQNEPSTYQVQQAFLIGTGVLVESIALGPGVDRNLLQMIADDTGGRLYSVKADEAAAASSAGKWNLQPTAASGDDMMLDLADRYLLASEDIHRRERIVEEWGALGASAVTQLELTLDEGGLEDCVVTLYANASSADVDLSIERPDGSTVPPPDPGYTAGSPDGSGHYWDPGNYVSYRIASMEDGDWTFDLANDDTSSVDYLFVVSGRSRTGVQVQLYFAQYHGNGTAYTYGGLFLRGLPMPILAVITDDLGPVTGAEVTALVEHPAFGAATLSLRDDGGTYDGAANDGVYAAIFTATTEHADSGGSYTEGSEPDVTPSYAVTLNSTGTDNDGRFFRRVNRGFFQIYESQVLGPLDPDSDGLPTRWEEQFDFLDPAIDNTPGDYDGDGLGYVAEYYLGTNPGVIDTDGGGETDMSEVDNGANPLNRLDDALRQARVARVLSSMGDVVPPPDETVYVITPGQNLVVYAVERDYDQVMIFRGPTSTGPYSYLGMVDADGAYIDSGLTNGTRYWYYIQPITADGRVGAPCRPFSGVPRSDSVPPSGLLRIGAGGAYTTSTSVDLHFTTSADAVDLKYALDPDLSATAWGSVTPKVSGYSLGTLSSGLPLTVFSAVRDGAGNVTRFDAGITYLAPGDAGVVTGTAVAPLDPDNRGVHVSLGGGNALATGPAGTFELIAPNGTHDLTLDLRGYQTALRPGLALASGSPVNVGAIVLIPLDTDGDLLPDVSELTQYGTDRYAADTDIDDLDDYEEVMVTMTDPNRADTDGDGISDGDEVLAGTDPNAPGSSPTILEVEPDDGDVAISFLGVSGRRYDVYRASTIEGGGDWDWVEAHSGADAPIDTVIPGFTGEVTFVRVRVVEEPAP